MTRARCLATMLEMHVEMDHDVMLIGENWVQVQVVIIDGA
jgi:hypothetical protein